MFNIIEKKLFNLESLINKPIVMKFFPESFISMWNNGNNTNHDNLNYLDKYSNGKLLIILTTFNRPESCLHVIRAIYNSVIYKGLNFDEIVFLILNDKSQSSYEVVKKQSQKMFDGQIIWLDSLYHLGKKYFWCTHQMAFLAAKIIMPTMYLCLQDDIDFPEDLLVQLDDMWKITEEDKNRRVIYLFSEKNDTYDINGRWIKYKREIHSSGLLRKTQWFDLQGFYADLKFLEMMHFWVQPIPETRWKKDHTISSGVGRQFTFRCFNNANIYQCNPSLITHGHEESMMNPEARARLPFDNRN